MKTLSAALLAAVATIALAPAAHAGSGPVGGTPIPPNPTRQMGYTVSNTCAGHSVDSGVVTVSVSNDTPDVYTLQVILDSVAQTQASGVNGASRTFTFRHVTRGSHWLAIWAEPWDAFDKVLISDCTKVLPPVHKPISKPRVNPVAHPKAHPVRTAHQRPLVKRHSNPAPRVDRDDKVHVVRPHDTLWSLAAAFLGSGYRWHEIARENGVRGTLIRVGQRLEIG